jgi:hypothetical protein
VAIYKAAHIRSRGLRPSGLDEKKSGKMEKQCFVRTEITEPYKSARQGNAAGTLYARALYARLSASQ